MDSNAEACGGNPGHAADLSLRHMRVFEKVAELEGIGKASAALALSQPAVTQAIEKIESQLGTVLFERRSRGTYPNAAGRILFGRVHLMFLRLEAALRDFGVGSGAGSGSGAGRTDTIGTVSRRISRKQILVLAAVANSASFADAARKLGISAVSLHRAARDLERTLGKGIFRDAGTGIVTTQAGAELARRAFLALREIDWAVEEIHAARGHLGGQLRVGAMPRAGSYLLGAALNRLQAHFPLAQVTADIASGVHLTRALRRGEIDVLVGMHDRSSRLEDLEQMALLSSPFVLVGRKDHPLARRSVLTMADLHPYQWVTPNRAASRRAIFDRLFAQMPQPQLPVIEANAFSTTRMLICGSDRLTLLTQYEFDHERMSGGIGVLPLPPIVSDHALGILWRSSWNPPPLHRKFMELLQAEAAQYCSGASPAATRAVCHVPAADLASGLAAAAG